MNRIVKWAIALLVIAALGFGVFRALSAKKAQQAAVAAQANQPTQATIELAQSDVLAVKSRELAQGLPISGALKAVNSAIIKARVAGELQALTVREGDMVKAGQVVARVDATDTVWRIKQAQDQADAAKAQIDIAQRGFDNNRSLVDQGFISKTALETSSAQLLGVQSTHKAALAAVELAKRSLEDTVLKSPISGVVAQRLAQPGERVGVDARVLEIVDLSRIELEATLSASDSVNVRVGQTASLSIEGATQALTAQVVRINPNAQAGSRSVLVYLAVNNAAGLRQGLFAQGNLGTGKQHTLGLPVSAVRTDKPAPYVQVVEGGKVVHKNVTLGNRGEADGELMVAISGLLEGSQVLQGNVGQLREGTLVRFTASGAKVASPSNPAAPASGAAMAASTAASR
jgi:RND family efflux transporter MFP subunit